MGGEEIVEKSADVCNARRQGYDYKPGDQHGGVVGKKTEQRQCPKRSRKMQRQRMEEEKDSHGNADRDAGEECDDKGAAQATAFVLTVASDLLNGVKLAGQLLHELPAVAELGAIIVEEFFDVWVVFHCFMSLRNCSRPRESCFLMAKGVEPMMRDISRTE